MRRNLITGVMILALVGFAIYWQSTNKRTADLPSQTQPVLPTIKQEQPDEVTVSVSDTELNKLRQGGSSYADSNGVYSFLYPNDYKIDSQNNGQDIRVYKQGPTQTGQTEMYDGVIAVFQLENRGDMDLSDLIDRKISEATDDGTSQLTEAKRPLTLNKYQGFTYKIRGLGESQYYVISKDMNSENVLVITTLVADPKNLGFQKEIDSILSTVEFYK